MQQSSPGTGRGGWAHDANQSAVPTLLEEDRARDLQDRRVTLHVASHQHSAIDGRMTRHASYPLSSQACKRVAESFSGMMTMGDFRCTRHRSLNRTGLAVHRVATTCHLPRTQPLPQGHTAPGTPQLVVDTQGLLLAVAAHPADLQDRDRTRLVLARLKHRFPRLRQLRANAAYTGPKQGTWVQAATDWTLAIVRHPQPGAGFQVLPRFREFLCCTG